MRSNTVRRIEQGEFSADGAGVKKRGPSAKKRCNLGEELSEIVESNTVGGGDASQRVTANVP